MFSDKEVLENTLETCIVMEENEEPLVFSFLKWNDDHNGRKYNLILVDPPWTYNNRTCMGAAENHYDTLSLDSLKMLPISCISADDSALFLWTTGPMFPKALELMTEWGYEYCTILFTWIKTTQNGGIKMGLGHYTRSCTEFLLFGKKGNISKLRPKEREYGLSQLIGNEYSFKELAQYHSQKPIKITEYIRQLFGDYPRCSIFERCELWGWDCFGDELHTWQDQRINILGKKANIEYKKEQDELVKKNIQQLLSKK